MNVGRIKVNGVETIISLGIDDDEIERNELNDDTLNLDEIVDALKNVVDAEHNTNWKIFKVNNRNM